MCLHQKRLATWILQLFTDLGCSTESSMRIGRQVQ
ncbi:unnamed protein product [Brassica oleracea]|uniref:Uncharacterized protein n=1 Tax=Brassica oleracea TaxID=3712 RepID=A0A3P6BGF3_BRAOL|nr:unnamed protein product [Brassica oleracea]